MTTVSSTEILDRGGPFVFVMVRALLGMIFELDRQAKTNVGLQVPRGANMRFNSKREWVEIINWLVQCRAKRKDSNNNNDGHSSNSKHLNGYGVADPKSESIEHDSGNDNYSTLEKYVYDG